MEIRLVVIRTGDMPGQVAFYQQLGIAFVQHRHGNGPMHYSAQIGTLVFELYPLHKQQAMADPYIRLGFAIDNFEARLETLRQAGHVFSEPADNGFGLMTVLTDPDGRRVEVYRK